MEAVPGCHAFCLVWPALFIWSLCSAACSSRCGWCEKALRMLGFFLSVAVRTSWRAVALEYNTSGTRVYISLLSLPQACISTQGCDFRLSHAVLWALLASVLRDTSHSPVCLWQGAVHHKNAMASTRFHCLAYSAL